MAEDLSADDEIHPSQMRRLRPNVDSEDEPEL